MTIQTVFERTEKKYLITQKQRKLLLEKIADNISPDKFGESTVCSLYFDTDDFRLIRNSIDKPLYKEKLRLRSYSTPNADSNVFLELKKKYRGVVYKRRETLKYGDVQRYFKTGQKPVNTQIMKEIEQTMNFYGGLKPKMFIGYDRTAFYGKEDGNLRITFDKNLRFRTDDLRLENRSFGEPIVDCMYCIMEIKALNSMPLWLAKALSELKIYPSSFSKYGTAYAIYKEKNHIKIGGKYCA